MNIRPHLTPWLFLLLVTCLISCRSKVPRPDVLTPEVVTKEREVASLLKEQISYNIKWIEKDSVTPLRSIPLQIPPVVFEFPTNVVRAREPKVVEIPDSLTVISPGKNGIPHPDTFLVERRVVPAYHSAPIPALAPQMRDAAISSISVLGVDQGMNSSNLCAILEDDQGLLWLATWGTGVMSYDGNNFVRFTALNGFTDVNVWTLFKDSRGHIWFGTLGDGLISYNGNTFTHYSAEGKFDDSDVKDIVEDTEGNLWFALYHNGLMRYDGNHFIHYTTKHGLSDPEVWSVGMDQAGTIWAGTRFGGVNRFDPNVNGALGSFTHYTVKEGLNSNFVKVIYKDSRGNLWLGNHQDSVGGVSLYSPEDLTSNRKANFSHYTTNEGLSHSNIATISEDRQGNLWFGSDGKGVNRFDGSFFAHFSTKEGLGHNNVLDITEDTWGNLWFGTWGGGAEMYAVQKASTHFPLDRYIGNLDIRCVFEDSRGDLWIGTYGSGVMRFQVTDLTIRIFQYTTSNGIKEDNVIAIEEDTSGNMWFGHRIAGVTRFEPAGPGNYLDGTFTHLTRNEGLVKGDCFSSISRETQGKIWIRSSMGIYWYDQIKKDSLIAHLTFEKECLNRSYGMLEDSRGDLWIPTKCGLVHYNVKSGKANHFRKSGLAAGEDSFMCIFEDHNGMLWFGTENNGVFLYKSDGSFSHLTINDGLLSNQVANIREDIHQRIWLSSEKGMTILLPEFSDRTDSNNQTEPTYKVITLNSSDGMSGADIGHQNFCIDSQNQLWTSAGRGLSMIDLNKLELPERAPDVRLKGVDIRQKPIDYRRLADSNYQLEVPLGKLLASSFDSVARYSNYPVNPVLPYGCNHLTFNFFAIDWAAPQKLQYSYRLVGQDEHWSASNKDAKADYRNLTHGDYIFQVKAIGAANTWSQVFEYPFSIRPPLWQTWWAYALYTVISGFLLFYLYGFLLRRQLALQEATQLRELDHFKTRLYTNITHEFRTPLTVISGMADQVLEHPKEWFREGLIMIKRNSSQLLQLVNQMLDLSKLESDNLPVRMILGDIIPYLKYLSESFHSYAESKDIRLHLLPDVKAMEMDFDPEKIQSIFTNLVGNAIKFTPAGGNVYVAVSVAGNPAHGSKLVLKVKDNGIGIPAAQLPFIFDRFYQADNSSTRGEGTGIGLSLTKELVKLLGGTIEIDSQEGTFTEFTVILPVSREAEKGVAAGLAGENHVPVWNAQVPESLAGAAPTLMADTELPLALLIEDNRDVLKYLAACLQGQYHLEMATNGREGIEKAIEQIPDIIISDVMMPEKDGFEVLATLKRDERTSHIPVVLLTAKSDMTSRLEGLERGADAYLAKPFEHRELEVVLRKLIGLRKQLQVRYGALLTVTNGKEGALPPENAFLTRLRQCVEQHMEEEEFGIHELCDALGISRTQLHRKLTALTGKSTSQVIRGIRMQKAKELLKDPNLNVAEVGYAVGYANPSHFTQMFTEEFGAAPSRFRGGSK